MESFCETQSQLPVPLALKWAVRIIPSVVIALALLLTGCAEIISRRDGELFSCTSIVVDQSGPEPGLGAFGCCLSGVNCALFPIALASDIILFPYDVYLRTKGFNILVQDESGQPISGAEINVVLYRYSGTYYYEGKTNSRGMRYVPRSPNDFERGRHMEVAVWCRANTFQSLCDMRPGSTFAQEMKTNTWTIIMHRERKE